MTLVLVAMHVDAHNEASALSEFADALEGRIAFLQNGDPSLVDVLDAMSAEGSPQARLVPLPSVTPAPGRSWLRRVAAHWLRNNPNGMQVSVVDSPVSDRAAPLSSPAWENIPGYRHHVLVCRGTRCSAQGAAATREALRSALAVHDLADEDVLVAQTACLYPCNHAPVVVVQPDDVWYGPVTAEEMPHIVAEHLVAGRPVTQWRRPHVRDQAPLTQGDLV